MSDFVCKWDGTRIDFVLNPDQKATVYVRFAGTSVRRIVVKNENGQIQHWRTCGGNFDNGVHLAPGDPVGEVKMDSSVTSTYSVIPEFQLRSCPPDPGTDYMGFTAAFEGPGLEHIDREGNQIFIRTFAIVGPLLSDSVSITIVMEDNTGGGG